MRAVRLLLLLASAALAGAADPGPARAEAGGTPVVFRFVGDSPVLDRLLEHFENRKRDFFEYFRQFPPLPLEQRIKIGEFDLNGDGTPELFYTLAASAYCGTAGCEGGLLAGDPLGTTFACGMFGHFVNVLDRVGRGGYRLLWDGEDANEIVGNSCLHNDEETFRQLDEDIAAELLPPTGTKVTFGPLASKDEAAFARRWLLPTLERDFDESFMEREFDAMRHARIGFGDVNDDGVDEVFYLIEHRGACHWRGCFLKILQAFDGGYRIVGDGFASRNSVWITDGHGREGFRIMVAGYNVGTWDSFRPHGTWAFGHYSLGNSTKPRPPETRQPDRPPPLRIVPVDFRPIADPAALRRAVAYLSESWQYRRSYGLKPPEPLAERLLLGVADLDGDGADEHLLHLYWPAHWCVGGDSCVTAVVRPEGDGYRPVCDLNLDTEDPPAGAASDVRRTATLKWRGGTCD